MRARSWAAVAVLVLAAGCESETAAPVRASANAAARLPAKAARCVLTLPDAKAARAAKARLERQVARYVGGKPGRIAYSALDLVSGVSFGHREHERGMITASGSKVDILMALLARRKELRSGERDLATRMIRESDNHAADSLWWRAGGGAGLAAFYRKLGLRETTPGPGRYWGGTTTTPADRVKLLQLLAEGGRGLRAADRGLVLALMGRVHRDQDWGVSAAARPGDRVALKNGWTPRPFVRNTWAVTSYGRVTGPGRDLLLSVQTDHQPSEGHGIATIEGLAKIVGTRLGTLTPGRTRACAAGPTA
ncbi:serine hydrolase [Nonomuraea sp. SBT364]|uniref:serine hydrolase n=1 Tax=Nonomuraea sp. SBT364 TaxID=1580530 RepID=UPI000B2AA25E|nr:serine hydrolase [Nonomuraea sp. SBT364]